jgi:hypothetical protein
MPFHGIRWAVALGIEMIGAIRQSRLRLAPRNVLCPCLTHPETISGLAEQTRLDEIKSVAPSVAIGVFKQKWVILRLRANNPPRLRLTPLQDGSHFVGREHNRTFTTIFHGFSSIP